MAPEKPILVHQAFEVHLESDLDVPGMVYFSALRSRKRGTYLTRLIGGHLTARYLFSPIALLSRFNAAYVRAH